MPAQISPMLAVSDAEAAIAFYKRAFGAEELWRIGDPAAVARLRIDGADIFLAQESPPHGTRSPDLAGHTTVRIELFVDDPPAVQRRAIAGGGRAKAVPSKSARTQRSARARRCACSRAASSIRSGTCG